VLPGLLREREISGRDAAFATELAYGTLRLQGRYDAILALASGRDVTLLDPPVLDVLRLGAHQLLAMRVPTHAAVSETVNLGHEVVGPAPTGLINAVLRKVAARDVEDWLDSVADGIRDAGEPWYEIAAAVESHPAWIVRALTQSLEADGRGRDELGDLLEADNSPARVTLVARPGWSSVGELRRQAAERGGEATDHPLPGAAELYGVAPGDLRDVATGRAGVQDAGSQLVAHALLAAGAPDDSDGTEAPGALWLDLCAGPGGKAALLAAEAQRRGAHLVAGEVQPHRADLVRRSVRLAGDSVDVVVGGGHDGASRILLDAPCTGLGALRRRPEARWRRSVEDLTELTVLQRELLDAAADALAPGGVLAYVTCSPHVAETRRQVAGILSRRPDLTLLDTAAIARSVAGGMAEDVVGTPVDGVRADEDDRNATDGEADGTGNVVQLWPHAHGTDAMFLALIRRD
jgi:16S rRNA (cytosine967-C5)-methyltransferase